MAENFELYTKLVAKICEVKLAYLISKDIKVDYIGKEATKISEKKIELDKESFLLCFPLEQIGTSLLVYSNQDQISKIADIFVGGNGEVDVELNDSQKVVYLDTLTQLLTSIFKYLIFKDDDFELAYGETRHQTIKANELQVVDMFGKINPITFKLKLTIDSENSMDLFVNVDEEKYLKFLTTLEKIFPDVDLDSIANTLKKELNSLESSDDINYDSFDEDIAKDHLHQVDETRNLGFISDVNLDLIVELGRIEMEFKDVLNLTSGSAIELDRHVSQSVDLYVHNQLIAKGEVVAIDDCFGLKITEVLGRINLFKDIASMVANDA